MRRFLDGAAKNRQCAHYRVIGVAQLDDALVGLLAHERRARDECFGRRRRWSFTRNSRRLISFNRIRFSFLARLLYALLS